MRILITGGSGFIGSPIIKKLIKYKRSHQILALTRQLTTELPQAKNINWIEADLNNLTPVASVIKNFKPDVVIHLAWTNIPDFSAQTCCDNLKQSLNFFQLIWSVGSCRKILVAGSCLEYGSKIGICSESDIANPIEFFSWAKLSLLNYLKLETELRGICFGWFRVFYAYGPNQRKGSVIPMVIDNLTKGKLPALEAPNNCNDFIYIADIAELFELAIDAQFPSGIYNIGSGEATSVINICKIAEMIILNQKKLSMALERETSNTPIDASFYAATELTGSVFDWKAKTQLIDGIKDTYLQGK